MVYNLTNVTNVTSTLALAQGINEVTDFWWARLFIIGIFILIWLNVTMKTGEAAKGMISASFVTVILSMMFYALEMVNGIEITMSILLLVGSVIIVYASGLN